MRIERLTQKATEAAKAFTSEIVAPIILGDLYPKPTRPEIPVIPITPVRKTISKDKKEIYDAPKRMATQTQRPTTRTENISRYRQRYEVEGTPQPPGVFPKPAKYKETSFRMDREEDGQKYERSQRTRNNI